MIIKTELEKENIVGVNANVLQSAFTLIEKVLDRVVVENNDILYRPKTPSEIESFYENVSVIIGDRLKNKLLK